METVALVEAPLVPTSLGLGNRPTVRLSYLIPKSLFFNRSRRAYYLKILITCSYYLYMCSVSAETKEGMCSVSAETSLNYVFGFSVENSK